MRGLMSIPLAAALAAACMSAGCKRHEEADLVIVSLNYPPQPQPVARLSSGLVTLIRRCPRPVLTVPYGPSTLQHALLAYDGSPKAREALFVATYISGRWNVPLTLLAVDEDGVDASEASQKAAQYLESHGVEADTVETTKESYGTVAGSILVTAEENGCDLVLMGGYGMGRVAEAVLGSAVDRVLRESRWPTLICR